MYVNKLIKLKVKLEFYNTYFSTFPRGQWQKLGNNMGIINTINKLIYRCTSRKPRQMIVQSRLWTSRSYKLVEITKSMKQEVYAL